MRPLQLTLVACAVAAVLAPAAALAQSPTTTQQPTQPVNSSADPQPESVRRPYRGVFAAPGDPTRQSLDVTASLFGAYDDDLLAGDTPGEALNRGYQQRGWYEGATAGLAYSHPGHRADVSLDGDVGVNNYPSLNDTTAMYHAGGALAWHIAQHTRANVSSDFVYAPQYRLGLFASPDALTGEADPFASLATDYDLFRSRAYRTSGQASLTQSLGHRSSFETYYSAYRVDYVADEFDYSNWTAGFRYSTRATQHLGYHIGYAYGTANYLDSAVNGTRRGIHNVDVGLDYSRALSFSRRTTFSFSTGSAIMSGQTAFSGPSDRGVYYRFTGDANLKHEIGRTWTFSLGYRRGVDWRERFNQPFLSDAATVDFGGLLSRRLRFSSSGDYTFGTVGFRGTDNGYDSASAQAGLEYALSRYLALFGRYVYYRYHFERGVALDPRFVPTLDRQGVRVGLSASLPVIR
jgi:hypothetical protein